MAAVARSRTPFDARAGALTRSLAGTGPAAHGVAPAGSAAVARNPPSTHRLFCKRSQGAAAGFPAARPSLLLPARKGRAAIVSVEIAVDRVHVIRGTAGIGPAPRVVGILDDDRRPLDRPGHVAPGRERAAPGEPGFAEPVEQPFPLRRGIGSAWTARRVFDHAVAPAVRRGKAVCDGR